MSHAEWIAFQCRRLGHPTQVTTWVRRCRASVTDVQSRDGGTLPAAPEVVWLSPNIATEPGRLWDMVA